MAEPIPEYFADGVNINVTGVSVSLTFNMSTARPSAPGQPSAQDVVNVRTTLEQAKLIAMLLKKVLKNWEDEVGTRIPVPRQILNQLNLSLEEDWGP